MSFVTLGLFRFARLTGKLRGSSHVVERSRLGAGSKGLRGCGEMRVDLKILC